VLCDYRSEVQSMAMHLVATPYDAGKLRELDQHVDSAVTLTKEEREVLKHFVRFYGKKERKRPRDRLLRDEMTKDVVMRVRKRTAFLGYTWRRMPPLDFSTTKPMSM
jgi:protein-serine/threonine kinase